MYYGFLRASELLQISWKTIEFNEELCFFRVFLDQSKCDQHRVGVWITIAAAPAGSGAVCPLRETRALIDAGGYAAADAGREDPDCKLMRGVVARARQGGHSLKLKPIVYTTLLDKIKAAFAAVGADPSRIGTHSLRQGGATGAARAEVPDRLAQGHGRWKGGVMHRHYVTEQLAREIGVTQQIMLLVRSSPPLEKVATSELLAAFEKLELGADGRA